jgi:hypothetical protein
MRSGNGALEKYYAGLGTFDTLALLGWFEELLKNLEIVQERTRQSAEQSTAVGTPLRTSMVGESRDQMTVEDEIIDNNDFNPKSKYLWSKKKLHYDGLPKPHISKTNTSQIEGTPK